METAQFRKIRTTLPDLVTYSPDSNELPTPADFGLTENDLSASRVIVKIHPEKKQWKVIGSIFVIILGLSGAGEVGNFDKFPVNTFVLSIVFSSVGLAITSGIIDMFFKDIEEPNPVFTRVTAYKTALRKWELNQKELAERPWRNMDGWQFEKAVAELFRKQGYTAEVTPGSGDHGVDIRLYKNNERCIVQCKQQAKPASPHIVRDLYGTLHSEKADVAILVCTGGFSEETVKWSSGKPIQLIGLPDIIKREMATFEAKQ